MVSWSTGLAGEGHAGGAGPIHPARAPGGAQHPSGLGPAAFRDRRGAPGGARTRGPRRPAIGALWLELESAGVGAVNSGPGRLAGAVAAVRNGLLRPWERVARGRTRTGLAENRLPGFVGEPLVSQSGRDFPGPTVGKPPSQPPGAPKATRQAPLEASAKAGATWPERHLEGPQTAPPSASPTSDGQRLHGRGHSQPAWCLVAGRSCAPRLQTTRVTSRPLRNAPALGMCPIGALGKARGTTQSFGTPQRTFVNTSTASAHGHAGALPGPLRLRSRDSAARHH